ncbi:MAG: hypothetical protein Q8O88_01120 [bacterium]|nr:hypothetical protein [bacterium]
MPVVQHIDTITVEELQQKYPVFIDDIVPQSAYARDRAEGIVFKNYTKQIFAKYVTEKFKEVNKETFGGNKKYSQNDSDRLVCMFCTNSRIEKNLFKLLDEGNKLEMPLMTQLPKRVLNDMMEEHWKEICMSSWSINFRDTRKKVTGRCAAVLRQMITNNVLNQNAK